MQRPLRSGLRQFATGIFLCSLRKSGAAEESSLELEEAESAGKIIAQSLSQAEEEVIVADELKNLQNGCFMAMVRKLTLKQRIAFSLVDMFGMNADYVAELLEVSPNTLKGLLFRARMNLDSFFADHCNLIDAKNPCNCTAWINFRESHEKNKSLMKKTISCLDYKEKDYRFNGEVRAKVNYLYSQMPEAKPSETWFLKVIEIFTPPITLQNILHPYM